MQPIKYPRAIVRCVHAGYIHCAGHLTKGAPADIIAVKGDLTHSFKKLEYPDLVMSGGKIVVNNFAN